MTRYLALLVGIVSIGLSPATAGDRFDAVTMQSIGEQIWQNEAAGRVDYLTWWNEGESFASLGIGHFIWFPPNTDVPFQESFPALLQFLTDHGVELPLWLRGSDPDCPWVSREAFFQAFDSPKMVQLRALLERTVGLQSAFIIQRFQSRWPEILLSSTHPERVAANHDALMRQPYGPYALVDYLNFKGDGTNPRERYAGEGWGLLQVLESMPLDERSALHRFAAAAEDVLTRRVQNAPPERNESRWLAGWFKRIETYRR